MKKLQVMKQPRLWQVIIPFIAAALWLGTALIIDIPIAQAAISPLFIFPNIMGVVFLLSYVIRRPRKYRQ